MKNYLCSALLAVLPLFLIAQGIITVEPPEGGASMIFTDLQKAIDEAPSGSRVVVSGGVWGISTIYINKSLHVLGAGFDIDSTNSTASTRIIYAIQLEDGADGTILEGLEAVNIGNTNKNGSYSRIQNINLKYIKTNGVSLYASTNNIIPLSNFIIQNSILGGINLGYSKRIKISNSIIGGISGINGQAIFENNIIFSTVSCIANAIFRNNVLIIDFRYYGYCGFGCTCPGVFGNYFYNNILLTPDQREQYYLDTWSGNKFNVDINSVFVKFSSDWSKFFQVNYEGNQFDFHLKPNSPAKNAGTDGTDIGIYGGTRPWREGAIPSNPHIQSKTIAPETDAQGRLNVNIRVKAQGN